MVVLAGAQLTAHHYGLSAYDGSKALRISGVLARVEWANPHAKLHVDARTAGGTTEEWVAETGSPNTLVRHGLDKSRLPLGQLVTLSGFRARDGSRSMIVRALTLPGGSTIDLSQQ